MRCSMLVWGGGTLQEAELEDDPEAEEGQAEGDAQSWNGSEVSEAPGGLFLKSALILHPELS